MSNPITSTYLIKKNQYSTDLQFSKSKPIVKILLSLSEAVPHQSFSDLQLSVRHFEEESDRLGHEWFHLYAHYKMLLP